MMNLDSELASRLKLVTSYGINTTNYARVPQTLIAFHETDMGEFQMAVQPLDFVSLHEIPSTIKQGLRRIYYTVGAVCTCDPWDYRRSQKRPC